MQSFMSCAFPSLPKGKSVCERGADAQTFLTEETAALILT